MLLRSVAAQAAPAGVRSMQTEQLRLGRGYLIFRRCQRPLSLGVVVISRTRCQNWHQNCSLWLWIQAHGSKLSFASHWSQVRLHCRGWGVWFQSVLWVGRTAPSIGFARPHAVVVGLALAAALACCRSAAVATRYTLAACALLRLTVDNTGALGALLLSWQTSELARRSLFWHAPVICVARRSLFLSATQTPWIPAKMVVCSLLFIPIG